ncbi:MAG TPA: polysaccharide deacetylase family protein [Thermoanaerobaculia bacterium]|nr:polysaccharide deacetylase family protein [Thermoanaerobaculia bacterium]
MPAPILTVDVEEWFHLCGHAAYSDPATWAAREKRVHVGTDRILELLAGTASKATFFVLGWVARQSPALVKRIAEAGHEIGCHGDTHRRVFELPPAEFREDVRRSRDTLQAATGKPVSAFRAPEWSMLKADNPALAILVEEGFAIDSSLTTAPPVGDLANPVRPAVLATSAGPILEVPPLMGTFFGRRALWGGGVCSRLTRERRVEGAIERSLAAGIPPVLYAHPWEFDPEHPEMPGLSTVQRLVHFAGRGRTEARWRRWLKRWTFAPISSAASEEHPGISANGKRGEGSGGPSAVSPPLAARSGAAA